MTERGLRSPPKGWGATTRQLRQPEFQKTRLFENWLSLLARFASIAPSRGTTEDCMSFLNVPSKLLI